MTKATTKNDRIGRRWHLPLCVVVGGGPPSTACEVDASPAVDGAPSPTMTGFWHPYPCWSGHSWALPKRTCMYDPIGLHKFLWTDDWHLGRYRGISVFRQIFICVGLGDSPPHGMQTDKIVQGKSARLAYQGVAASDCMRHERPEFGQPRSDVLAYSRARSIDTVRLWSAIHRVPTSIARN
jgi:hypothetical protein